MTFKSLILREVARERAHGRHLRWVAVRGSRSDDVRRREAEENSAAGLRRLRERVESRRRSS
jgi:hypothetical protein